MHQSGVASGSGKEKASLTSLSSNAAESTLALVGFPNSGKTTLFNLLTGMNFTTVNYPGATVEYSRGEVKGRPGVWAVDTPGVGSLLAFSPEEKVTVDYLLTEKPSNVLVVLDANQLSRHLYLVDQLKFLGFRPLLVVTMMDVSEKRGRRLDLDKLSSFTDCPVLGLDPRRKSERALLANFLDTQQNEIHSPKKSLEDLKAHYNEDTIGRIFESLNGVDELLFTATEAKQADAVGGDSILMHPVWGVVTFVALMVFIFSSIFWLATPFMDAIDAGFGWTMEALSGVLPEGWFSDFIVNGLVAGLGSVAVFLPQIVILFLFMGVLEDSGYLARGAAIVDRPLKKIGLNGKSFVPLLSGYACAIPAMMAARTIKSPLERKLTLLIIPLMSCSARLPVYVLLIAFLAPPDKPWLAGLCLAGLYFGGLVMGAVVSTLVHRFTKHDSPSYFIQEIPPIRRPVLRIVGYSTFMKAKEYFVKAGPIILIISALLWVFTHTPAIGVSREIPSTPVEESEYVSVSNSLAAQLGQWIEPVTKPLGLDWRGGVALMSGFAAREVFVASMAMIYRLDDLENEEGLNKRLITHMREITFLDSGQKVFTTSTVLGLILFYMIALQCFPTVAVAKKEFGSAKLALLQLGVFTGGAYVLTLVLVQGLRAVGVS